MTPETGLFIGSVCFALACLLGVVAEIAKIEAIRADNIERLKNMGVIK